MKITIVKKAVANAKPQGYCNMMIDDAAIKKT